jgi:hypothetical protein
MKNRALTLMLMCGSFAICVAAAAAGESRAALSPAPFDKYDGYFVSNKFENREPMSFVVLNSQTAFDKVFGIAMVMGDKSHRLPSDVFDRSLVVAAIHRGKAFVEYEVEKVGLAGKALEIRYRAHSTPSDSTEYACPLILSVARGDYDAVRFVENGREIRIVRIQRRPSATFEINCREPGTLKAENQDGRGILIIHGGRGIGEATIRPGAGTWPEETILRAYLSGLESLKISAGNVTLAASVSSHSGNEVLLHLDSKGKEGPQLGIDSPYWMEIKTRGANGKSVPGLPPQGGWFEATIPNALLSGAGELKVSWIDFYR